MNANIVQKVQTYLGAQALYKDSATTGNLFAGRNLPSFVKDMLMEKMSIKMDSHLFLIRLCQ